MSRPLTYLMDPGRERDGAEERQRGGMEGRSRWWRGGAGGCGVRGGVDMTAWMWRARGGAPLPLSKLSFRALKLISPTLSFSPPPFHHRLYNIACVSTTLDSLKKKYFIMEICGLGSVTAKICQRRLPELSEQAGADTLWKPTILQNGALYC